MLFFTRVSGLFSPNCFIWPQCGPKNMHMTRLYNFMKCFPRRVLFLLNVWNVVHLMHVKFPCDLVELSAILHLNKVNLFYFYLYNISWNRVPGRFFSPCDVIPNTTEITIKSHLFYTLTLVFDLGGLDSYKQWCSYRCEIISHVTVSCTDSKLCSIPTPHNTPFDLTVTLLCIGIKLITYQTWYLPLKITYVPWCTNRFKRRNYKC